MGPTAYVGTVVCSSISSFDPNFCLGGEQRRSWAQVFGPLHPHEKPRGDSWLQNSSAILGISQWDKGKNGQRRRKIVLLMKNENNVKITTDI